MLSNQVQIYQYNGSPVTFQKGDSVMVNATEMAKPFGKRSADFLTLKSTNELIHSLSAKTGIPVTALVLVNQGGNNQGTWMHEDLALIFAQWLSPQFYLWCNDHIKELLTTGVTTASDDDAAIAHAMEILNRRLEQAKAEKQLLEAKAHEQERVIQEQAPKVEYFDDVLNSTQPPPTPQPKSPRSSAGAQKPSTANSTKKACSTSKADNGSSMPSTRTKATPAPSPVPTQAPPAKSTPHSKPCGPNPADTSFTHCSTN